MLLQHQGQVQSKAPSTECTPTHRQFPQSCSTMPNPELFTLQHCLKPERDLSLHVHSLSGFVSLTLTNSMLKTNKNTSSSLLLCIPLPLSVHLSCQCTHSRYLLAFTGSPLHLKEQRIQHFLPVTGDSSHLSRLTG